MGWRVIIGKAYLVLGPESSGTRLVTEVLINAGCIGSSDHIQPFDTNNFNGQSPIVWRRSIPHNAEWLNLKPILDKLSGYQVTAVVVVRDWWYVAQSQLANGHAQSIEDAYLNLQNSYCTLSFQLRWYKIPFIVVTYESLILNDQAQSHIISLLGLRMPESFVLTQNSDQKYD